VPLNDLKFKKVNVNCFLLTLAILWKQRGQSAFMESLATHEDSCQSEVSNSSRGSSSSVSKAITRKQQRIAYFLRSWENKG
jgi:hypothetical protein